MPHTLLLTGATDGLGRLAAEMLAARGHRLLLHGRDAAKLAAVAEALGDRVLGTYRADLADLDAVLAMAEAIRADHTWIDVLIHNAGVLKTPTPRTPEGLDVRFLVNVLAPMLLTRELLPLLPADGRVVSVSSAAQSPVDLAALRGERELPAMAAYGQSKLALAVWSQAMGEAHPDGPVFVAVNPGSLLASKMVREGFGIAGRDPTIGADILCRAALDPAFAAAHGRYYDNDDGAFGVLHPAGREPERNAALLAALEALLPVRAAG